MFKWKKRDPKAPSKRADFIVCWIKDLLDERAKQTKYKLRDKKGRCCIGVACDTAKFKWDINEEENSFSVRYGKDNQYIESQVMPSPLFIFLKTDENVSLMDNITVDGYEFKLPTLAILNDDKDLSFREIARVIQTYCEIMFRDLSKKEIKYIKGFKIPTRQEMRDNKKAA